MKLFLALLLPVLIAWAAALQWIVDGWLAADSYYSHGILLPLVGAWGVWQRRARLLPGTPSGLGWPLLFLALLVHAAGIAVTVDSLSAVALVPAVAGVVLLGLGRAPFVASLPLLGLLLLAVPLPLFVTGELAFWLKDLAAGAATALARATGLQVVQSGSRLFVPGCADPMLVGDPCSGLRSLVALFTLGYCFAFFSGGPGAKRRIILVMGGAVLAMGANILRLLVLMWIAHGFGMEVATTTAHEVSNYVIYGIAIAGLLVLERYLPTAEPMASAEPPASAEPLAAPAAPRPAPVGLKVAAALLWLLAPVLCWLQYQRPEDPSTGRAGRIPTALGPWQRQTVFPLSDRWYGLLGTRDVLWATYKKDGSAPIHVIAVFHGANWKVVHPPHVCLRGDGFAIDADVSEPLTLAGQPMAIGWLQSSRSDQRLLTAYAFGTTELVTSSYGSYFLHHAPRSLLRRLTPGFLLRIETEFADGGLEAARARCLEVLEPALRSAQDAVR
jgi:exosortase